ncbi:MAG: hypothetical protein ACRDE5_12155 [Ginsengibacter sp.]
MPNNSLQLCGYSSPIQLNILTAYIWAYDPALAEHSFSVCGFKIYTANSFVRYSLLMPDDADLVHGNHTMKVKSEALKEGDIILIKPGEKVAADGCKKLGIDTYLAEVLPHQKLEKIKSSFPHLQPHSGLKTTNGKYGEHFKQQILFRGQRF